MNWTETIIAMAVIAGWVIIIWWWVRNPDS